MMKRRLASLLHNQRVQVALVGILVGCLLGGVLELHGKMVTASPKTASSPQATATPTLFATQPPDAAPPSQGSATPSKPKPPSATVLPAPSATLAANATSVAQRMRGINMSLFDGSDQLANNAGTVALLARYHTSIIRMPFRDAVTDADDSKALTAIKSVGATPLVIVHGKACFSGDTATVDSHWLGLVRQVFGQAALAYVEYGNEEDLSCNNGGGIDANTYTQAWNAVIPQLKSQFPTFKFVGPVNYQANPSYIATFAANANPRPDDISWHEYVCSASASDQTCLSHIANWSTHVSQTNSAVQQALGHTLPILITEWNLDPNDDARYSNAGFIQQWTTQALQAWSNLSANGVYAAMIYSAESHASFQLINSDNSLTAQGQAFFA